MFQQTRAPQPTQAGGGGVQTKGEERLGKIEQGKGDFDWGEERSYWKGEGRINEVKSF